MTKTKALLTLLLLALFLSQPPPAAAQDETPTPAPADRLTELESRAAVQDNRLADLEAEWLAIRERGELAVNQALWGQLWLPAFLLLGLLSGVLYFVWQSRVRFEQEMATFRAEEEKRADARRRELDRRAAELEKRSADLERRYEQQLAAVIGEALATLECRMLPIRLPGGHNLGELYRTLSSCGYENLTWYDQLDDRPFPGVTLIFAPDRTQLSRFEARLTRLDEKLNPRRHAFTVYCPSGHLAPEILARLQQHLPNLAGADTPMGIAGHIATLARGLHADVRAGMVANSD